MKRRVLILKPRLDLPFKRFGLNIPNKNIIPIRVHWQNFVDKLHEYHTMRHDRVVVVEEEKWKFNNMLIDYYAPDIAYVLTPTEKTFLVEICVDIICKQFFLGYLQSTKKVGVEMLHMQKMVGKLHLMKIELLIYSKKEQTEVSLSLINRTK